MYFFIFHCFSFEIAMITMGHHRRDNNKQSAEEQSEMNRRFNRQKPVFNGMPVVLERPISLTFT